MSHTIRRRSGDPYYKKVLTEPFERISGTWQWKRAPLDPSSKEYKIAIARYHSDGHKNFKEPGPHWYRNIFTERPQRREAKRQLKLYIQNPDYEVVLNTKDPLVYWT